MVNPAEPHNKGPDGTVGSLVWVRRRNGSWWPGQVIEVVEVDEPSKCSMASTKVPVKLLGIDDPTVDYYECKSIKSFRCGEFDTCIEKAKRAALNSRRTVTKFALRKAAIIHALEIEKDRRGGDPNSPLSAADGDLVGGRPRGRGRPRRSGTPRGRGRPPVTDRPRVTPTGRPRERPRKTPVDWEDDRTEGVRRMRRVADLGMGGTGLSQRVKVEPVSLTEEEPSKYFSTSSDEGQFKTKWNLKRKRTSRHARPEMRANLGNDDGVNVSLDHDFGWSGCRSLDVSTAKGYMGAKISTINPGSLPDLIYGPGNQDGSDFGLCDVKLEVQASSWGQHVPGQHTSFISVMSQTANQPIVGHPLTVEILEEGSTEDMLNGAYISSRGLEMNTFVPEHGRKRNVGRPRAPPKHLKLHRVSPEKSSKKIRKLSSLTGFSKGTKSLGLEKIIIPVIACVPLEVAYSRLKAAFRRSMQDRRRARHVVKRSR